MTKLTPQQLETAARKLCDLQGYAPETDEGGAQLWEVASRMIKDHLQLQEAINFAMEPPESEEARNYRLIQERNREVIRMAHSTWRGL